MTGRYVSTSAALKRPCCDELPPLGRGCCLSQGVECARSGSFDLATAKFKSHWYKLAIYLGAVLFILGFVFVNNSNVTKYTSFAVESLILGLVVWILDDTLYAIGSSRIDEAYDNSAKRDTAKNTAAAILAVRWIGLFIWIVIILAYI